MVNERCGLIVFWQMTPDQQIEIMGENAFYYQPKGLLWLASILGLKQKDASLSLDYYDEYLDTLQLPLCQQKKFFWILKTGLMSYLFFMYTLEISMGLSKLAK